MRISRFFTKFYNEVKVKPVKIPEHLKHNLRNSTSAQIALRSTMKQFRAQLPLLSLLEIAKASRAYIKANYFIPNLVSPNDPILEPVLRKHLIQDIVNPIVAIQKEYYEDRLFMLDRSVEARRNFLLAKEAEKVERALRLSKDAKRIEELKKKEFRISAGGVEEVLDGEVNTQMVVADTHTVVSYKGVVKMSSEPGKMSRFVDFTGQELGNYIVFNLESSEQALQMFEKSMENENFDSNLRAKLIQKLAVMKKKTLPDKRLLNLINSVKVSELSKKNLSNTIWAICKLYREIPKSLNLPFTSMQDRFEEMIPISNSMNLAYVCEGFSKLKHFPSEFPEKVAKRFTELIEHIEVPESPKDFIVSYINIPVKGHSMYYGSKDLTIPTTLVPTPAMFKILRYLEASGKVEALPYLYKKCAVLLNQLSMFELDRGLLIEGLTIYGKLSEGLRQDPDVNDCILNMTQLVVKYYEELIVPDICTVANALMGAGGFRFTSWFRLLELKAFEAIDSVIDFDLLLKTTAQFTRYQVAMVYGRDLEIEPLLWLNETLLIETPLLYKVYTKAKTTEIPSTTRCKLGILMGLMGYSVEIPIENSIYSLLAASVQRLPHPGLKNLPIEDLLILVNSTNDINEICALAAVLAKSHTEVDWEYFVKFYDNNKHSITSQPHRIALAWALKRKVDVDYEKILLTLSEQALLDEIKSLV